MRKLAYTLSVTPNHWESC